MSGEPDRFPLGDRQVPATADHIGMTQIERGGQCFQAPGVGLDVWARLEQFAAATLGRGPMPDYGRRWPDPEEQP